MTRGRGDAGTRRKAPKATATRLLGLVLGMAASLAVIALIWRWREPDLAAQRLERELADAPDAEVADDLRQLSALGDAGLPLLADALGSNRACVRDAARPLLIEEVDRWELLPAEAASAKLSILAHALVGSAGRLDSDNRRFAAELAQRVLLWPNGAAQTNRAALLADCDTILSTVARADARAASDAQGLQPLGLSSTANANHSIADYDTTATLPDQARMPGGGLPVELASMPPPVDFSPGALAKNGPAGGEPHRLPDHLASRPLDGDAPNLLRQPPGANQPRRLPSADDFDSGQTRLLHAETGTGSDDAVPRPDDPAAWKRLELRQVMRELHSPDPRTTAAAQTELGRRGIRGSQLELARRVTDPDPKTRRQFAESLPALAGVDARPWLMELSYDADPKVRATAVTLMATSGDLDLMRRVQQISLDDPDDYTRAQAQKALPGSKHRE